MGKHAGALVLAGRQGWALVSVLRPSGLQVKAGFRWGTLGPSPLAGGSCCCASPTAASRRKVGRQAPNGVPSRQEGRGPASRADRRDRRAAEAACAASLRCVRAVRRCRAAASAARSSRSAAIQPGGPPGRSGRLTPGPVAAARSSRTACAPQSAPTGPRGRPAAAYRPPPQAPEAGRTRPPARPAAQGQSLRPPLTCSVARGPDTPPDRRPRRALIAEPTDQNVDVTLQPANLQNDRL